MKIRITRFDAVEVAALQYLGGLDRLEEVGGTDFSGFWEQHGLTHEANRIESSGSSTPIQTARHPRKTASTSASSSLETLQETTAAW
jgi:hypothetical protein